MEKEKETIKDIEFHGEMLRIDVSHEKFLQEMFKWLTSKGWSFRGTTKIVEPKAKPPQTPFQ